MCYDRETCDLMAFGGSSDVWRVNLEQGRFLSSIETDLEKINCGAINPLHQLLAFGGEDGVIQCFDPRTRYSIAAKICSSFSENLLPRRTCELTSKPIEITATCKKFNLKRSDVPDWNLPSRSAASNFTITVSPWESASARVKFYSTISDLLSPS